MAVKSVGKQFLVLVAVVITVAAAVVDFCENGDWSDDLSPTLRRESLNDFKNTLAYFGDTVLFTKDVNRRFVFVYKFDEEGNLRKNQTISIPRSRGQKHFAVRVYLRRDTLAFMNADDRSAPYVNWSLDIYRRANGAAPFLFENRFDMVMANGGQPSAAISGFSLALTIDHDRVLKSSIRSPAPPPFEIGYREDHGTYTPGYDLGAVCSRPTGHTEQQDSVELDMNSNIIAVDWAGQQFHVIRRIPDTDVGLELVGVYDLPSSSTNCGIAVRFGYLFLTQNPTPNEEAVDVYRLLPDETYSEPQRIMSKPVQYPPRNLGLHLTSESNPDGLPYLRRPESNLLVISDDSGMPSAHVYQLDFPTLTWNPVATLTVCNCPGPTYITDSNNDWNTSGTFGNRVFLLSEGVPVGFEIPAS